MKNVPKDSAIFALSKDWRIWNRFEAECRYRGVITLAFMMVSRGQAKDHVVGRYTAFQLLEPEAEAWLKYFRGVGATAPGGSNGEAIEQG